MVSQVLLVRANMVTSIHYNVSPFVGGLRAFVCCCQFRFSGSPLEILGVQEYSTGQNSQPLPLFRLKYCKIPIISPGLIFVQKTVLLGLFSGELIITIFIFIIIVILFKYLFVYLFIIIFFFFGGGGRLLSEFYG